MKRVELYINDTLVDLHESGLESLFIISKQIQDIREPEKRQTDYSRNIQVPGSKSNNILFSYLYELSHDIQNSTTTNFNPDFNPNLKAECVVYLDGVQFFKGIAQLTDISVTYNRQITYNLTLLGKLANIFTDIGQRELTDLDLSRYDHTFLPANTINSWETSIIKNGSTFINFSGGHPTGQGYVYPLIDYGFSTDVQNFNFNNLYPGVYAKEYIDRIFEDAGYTYTSTFLNSTFFKHLVIPYNSSQLRLTSAQVLQRKFRASKVNTHQTVIVPTGQANSSGVTVVFNNDTTAPNSDISNQYNTNNGGFTCANTGLYTFVTQLRLNGRFVPDTPGVQVRSQYTLRCHIEITKAPLSGPTVILQTSHLDIGPFDPFTTDYTTANPASVTPLDPDYILSPWNPRNYANVTASNVFLQQGEMIGVRVRAYLMPNQYGTNNFVTSSQKFQDTSTNAFYDGSVYLNIETGSLFYNTIDNTQILEGQPLLMNNAIPPKVKQKDFLLSIFKMFNLYVEQGDVDNNLIIEDRNSYYNNTVVDWSDKWDISKEMIIKPMGALDVRRYLFKYKEDSDYYNKIYNDAYPLDYGEREVVINNDFLKGDKINELIFSPTPSVGATTHDRVIPRIIKVSDTGVVSGHEGNIRILYYGGLKECNQVWYLNSSGQTYTFGEYPYIGHLDDPYSSTLDLCWYPPAEIYWGDYFHSIWYSNNNLYNRYWKQFIEEITDKNSKIVQAHFRLGALDIKNIDFRKLFYWNDEYFRLNKLIDYNPISEGITKCEFVKVKAAVPFQSSSGVLTDSADEVTDLLPTMHRPAILNYNTGEGSDIIINGTGNRTNESVKSAIINGDSNIIGDYSKSILVLNSSGVNTPPGVRNLTVFNTENKRVRNGDAFMVGGQVLYGPDTLETIDFTGALRTRAADDVSSTVFCDTSSGNISIQLEDPKKWIGLKRTYKKISNDANTVTLIPFSGGIDNAASFSFSGFNESYTIQSNGKNYYITEKYIP